MLFNSYTFFIFFTVTLAFHYLRLPWRVKKFNLLVASYLFYAAWNPPFVLLLWISTIVDWHCARWIHSSRLQSRRNFCLAISLATNLGFLAFFKYANFFLETFTVAAASYGIDYAPPNWDIVLPVGISFYTFQTLSYTIDVYRKRMTPWNSRLDFALYVTFFPQLVAGPIVRAVDFLPQCLSPRFASPRQFVWGLCLLLLGIFQKNVVADGILAPIVEEVYDTVSLAPDSAAAWAGTCAFAGQIFCDFSGYSTCAIGIAMCLGFAIPDNFRFPYAAIGFSDFWGRWHISLSTWLRDYLYIPLGGNRHGQLRTNANLMMTMLLGGLWHGASWTFVVWGGLHGLYLIAERGLRGLAIAKFTIWQTRIGQVALMLGTFLAICVTWVFFRAASFSQAFTFLNAMIGIHSTATTGISPFHVIRGVVPTACILCVHAWLRNMTLEEAAVRIPAWLLSLFLAAMLIAIVMASGEDRAFIYFQF